MYMYWFAIDLEACADVLLPLITGWIVALLGLIGYCRPV